LLEACDLGCLHERVTPRALAAVLHANQSIGQVWRTRHPDIYAFIDKVTTEYGPASTKEEFDFFSDEIVWEIAELLVYHRYPKIYDERVAIAWNFDELTSEVTLEDRVVVDVGAGTGRIAFQAAPIARWVFAVEPVTSIRRFMRERKKMMESKTFTSLMDCSPISNYLINLLMY